MEPIALVIGVGHIVVQFAGDVKRHVKRALCGTPQDCFDSIQSESSIHSSRRAEESYRSCGDSTMSTLVLPGSIADQFSPVFIERPPQSEAAFITHRARS